jgi:ATP-dependent helicase/nuclease subunit A
VPVPTPSGPIPLFHPRVAEAPRAVRALLDQQEQREAEEDLRLLYVGLTRAADHLYIGGAVPARALGKLADGKRDCWHARLAPVLASLPGVERLPTDAGEALRLRAGAWGPPGPHAAAVAPQDARQAVQTVHVTPAPPPPRPWRPLTPSGLPEPPPEGPAAEAMRAAARRGTLIHTLFERLPALPPEAREAQALAWLDAQGAGAQGRQIAAEVLAVLADPAHADLFGPTALAEAPVAGLVGDRMVAGILDRLLVEPDRVRVVDFKTGLRVPPAAAEAPVGHRRQMAAYAAVLAQAFPGRRIEAALLYTAAPKFLLLSDKDMAGLLPLD